MKPIFRDRCDAGQHLADRLQHYCDCNDVVVIGLPRGGVPVASEIAQALQRPLDICVVRKLGVPGHPELAMGALSSAGHRVIDRDVIREFGISEQAIEQVTLLEGQELNRRIRVYRDVCPPLSIAGLTIIVVDDGVATGCSLRVALSDLRQAHPRRIVLAAPVIAAAAYRQFQQDVDDLVTVVKPESLYAISAWYETFTQTSDAQVCHLLQQASTYRP